MSDKNQGMTAEREALHTRIYELSGFAGHDDAPMLTFHENIVLGWASEAESMGSEIRRLRAENEELKRGWGKVSMGDLIDVYHNDRPTHLYIDAITQRIESLLRAADFQGDIER